MSGNSSSVPPQAPSPGLSPAQDRMTEDPGPDFSDALPSYPSLVRDRIPEGSSTDISDSLPPSTSPTQDADLARERIPEDLSLDPSDFLLPGPSLTQDIRSSCPSTGYFDNLLPIPGSAQDGMPEDPNPGPPDARPSAPFRMFSTPRQRSPDVLPLDAVPSFRTIDPLRSPPPKFADVPPTPPVYVLPPPPSAPQPPPGGTRRFSFTFPTWQEVQAAFDRLRTRSGSPAGSGAGPEGGGGTKKRKRDRARKALKRCWRKLGLSKKKDNDDEESEAPGNPNPVPVVPIVPVTIHSQKR